MPDLDRRRAETLMQSAGMDALVLFQPEAFRYATGLDAGVAAMWRRAGASIAIVPADSGARAVAILSDHAAQFLDPGALDLDVVTQRIWIDYLSIDEPLDAEAPWRDLARLYDRQALGGPRPESFSRETAFALLSDALADLGLSAGVIGCDLEFVPAADFAALQAALPGMRIVDGSEVLRRLRSVKSPRELQCLVDASDASEEGLRDMAGAIADGISAGELAAIWEAGARRALAWIGRPSGRMRRGISVGPDLSDTHACVNEGAFIKADMGVEVDHYQSDGTRTWCYGVPGPAALRIYAVLEEAFETGLAKIRPGNALGEVHAAVLEVTRRRGMAGYCRGHFGHSIGASCGSEEWPFISAGNRELILPGMMLAYETPFYAQGLGAMMIEDQVMVTETGAVVVNKLPRTLGRITRG